MRVMTKGTYISKLYTHCTSCGKPKSRTTAPHCRDCYTSESEGKPFGQRAVHKLRLQDLDEEQRTLYAAIMKGRQEDQESQADALGIIQLATERGELAEELEWWETPAEPSHFLQTTIAVMIQRGLH